MIRKGYFYLMLGTLAISGLFCNDQRYKVSKSFLISNKDEKENDEIEADADRRRSEYEFRMLRDPATGKIPDNIREKELAFARNLPSRNDPGFRLDINNTYAAIGPSQQGGRTRALKFDVRYNGTSNKVILAGGVNGGIFRSTDGGQNWTFVSPLDDIRSVTCLAQDTRTGFEDTWYAGTGEADQTAFYPSGFVFGFGIFKSTDNGATWTKLNSTILQGPNEFAFDNFFDFINNIAVHPLTGDVYAATVDWILRSTDGGNTWSRSFGSVDAINNATTINSITDVHIPKDGSRVFIAVTGRNPDRDSCGVWVSTSGNSGTYTRIAGGPFGNADSVAGWKAYNNNTDASSNYLAGWGRTILTTAPSNSNILFVMYDNGIDNGSGTSSPPEADLFRADLSAGLGSISWSNRSANLRAKRNNTTDTYLKVQSGYDMAIAVHPTNQNLVIIGGVDLIKSTDGFSTFSNNTYIGGRTSPTTYTDLGNGTPTSSYSHVDIHAIAFDPSSANRMAVGSDGGLTVTSDVTAGKVTWDLFNRGMQTIQYYKTAIDPEDGSLTVAGGAQDNNTTFRDTKGLIGSVDPDPNNHYRLIGGDGGCVGITKKNGSGDQYLFGSAQLGNLYKVTLKPPPSFDITSIVPSAAGDGEFVTTFLLDPDNTDVLYYASLDSIWRTTSSTTVTNSSGWTLMSGVGATLSGSIFSMATTRGAYSSSSNLFLGTDNGKVYRLSNPRDAAATTSPVNISPLGTANNSVVADIAVNPRNQDTVMCVISNYSVQSIYWTGNATSASPTWQGIEGNISLPSIRSCEIVVTTSGVEYYVGTSVGLYSTTTINSSSTIWANEGTGALKTAIIDDMACRWSDNSLVVATHGNGMYLAQIGNAVVTGINDPIRNDKSFISKAFPTLVSNNFIFYQTGDLTGIKKIHMEILGMNGQVLLKKDYSFQSGTISLNKLAAGNYILNIYSDDKRYQFVQKFVKTN